MELITKIILRKLLTNLRRFQKTGIIYCNIFITISNKVYQHLIVFTCPYLQSRFITRFGKFIRNFISIS
jgi:hypothetical protein